MFILNLINACLDIQIFIQNNLVIFPINVDTLHLMHSEIQ